MKKSVIISWFSVAMVTVVMLFGFGACTPEQIPTADDITELDPMDIPDTDREMRAVWIATVSNIDWPSERGLPVHQQKAELRAMLDRIEMLNMNTVIFQVRPATDALYNSDLEPWSEYLTGAQGKAPEPYYDPLGFAIEEAHKRGLELHAWINPFRSRHPSARSDPADNHLSKTHPDLVVEYGRHLWMDPGHPDAHDWSLRVILDIIDRYDVDGIHADDYFYPYKERDDDDNLIDFPDSATYTAYVAEHGEIDRNDWRRQNVDTFIERLYREIRESDPLVRLSISPIGLWRPDHQGDEIEGFDAYEEIYADARKWFAEGWLDFFVPQLYWPIDQQGQRYPVLVDWWHEQNDHNRHFYPGNFTNRVRGDTWPVNEITDQIRITRDQEGTTGNVHFSMRALMENPQSLVDSLKSLYHNPALVPATDWLGEEKPAAPEAELIWILDEPQLNLHPTAADTPWLYVVKTRYGDTWKTRIIPGWRQNISVDPLSDGVGLNGIVVSAVNRLGLESDPVVVTGGS